MKRVEVGRLRVLLDNMGEGAVIIDQAPNGDPHSGGRLTLEPGELQDLIVALDGVSNDRPAPKDDEPRLHKVQRIMRDAAHALAVLGIRTRIEFHVDWHVLNDLAYDADREAEPDERRRHDTAKISLGVGRIIAQRGRVV